MAADEEGTHARLKALRQEYIEPRIAEHRGHIVKLTGDGALVEFPSVVDAINCAIALQKVIPAQQANIPVNQRIYIRIGINIGDVIMDDGDIYGDGVNIAARLEPLAEPGGVCVSRTVYEYAKSNASFTFEPMGQHQVKNIPEPVTVYRVVTGNETTLSRTPSRAKLRLSHFVVSIVILALGSAVIFPLWYSSWSTQQSVRDEMLPSDEKPWLAVLPFDNLSDDSDQEYFADGLTDDLITDLSKISGLSVIARNSVFAYKGGSIDVRDIAKGLNVDYVLEGSVRRAGRRVRINAQLVDGKSGNHLWADRFDREAEDVFSVQDEVIQHIIQALAVELSASEEERLDRPPTTNLEAYDYYLRAEQASRSGFRPRLREALDLYKKAIVLDPEFADAYAADARTAAYAMRSNYDDVIPGPVARKRAYQNAGRALEIASGSPLPFAVLAILQVVDDRHDEALESAKQAVALGPSDAEAHAALSLVLTFIGHHEEAVEAIVSAMRLNPSLPTSDQIVAGLAFLLNDDAERAIEILEDARAEAPNVDDVHAILAAAYASADRFDEARLASNEVLRISPSLSVEQYRIIFAQFRHHDDRVKILDALSASGLPQWPYGFSADPDDKLMGEEISQLALGRTWQGRIEAEGPALAQIQSGGELALRTARHISTGSAFVADDMLCEQIELLSFGFPARSAVPSTASMHRHRKKTSFPTFMSTRTKSFIFRRLNDDAVQLKRSCSISVLRLGQFFSALASQSSRAGPSSSST